MNKRIIYVIKNSNTNVLKIGISTNPEQRLKNLKTGSSDELKIIYQRETVLAAKVERNLHNYFQNKRLHGEWFDLNEDDISNIHNLIVLFEKAYLELKLGENSFI